MIQYILECIAFQLVFLIIYDFFLKRETFFQWNRVYLIGTYLLSLLLPWVRIEALKTAVPERYYRYPEYLWGANDAVAIAVVENSGLDISWGQAILLGGMLLAALLFGYKMLHLYRLRTTGNIQHFADFTRIVLSNSDVAFSFFKSIFLGDRIVEKEHKNIIEHELVHIRQKHTYDLLFFEMMRIVSWFNPLVYVYQNRVSELHEFIADGQVAKTDKKGHYEMLLSQAFQSQNISFINQFFNSSLIKKRIVMLTKEKSKRIWQLKYLLLLPLVSGMLMYSSCESDTNLNANEIKGYNNGDYEQVTNEFQNLSDEQTEDLLRGLLDKMVLDKQILSKDEYFKFKYLSYHVSSKPGIQVQNQDTLHFLGSDKPFRRPSDEEYEYYVDRTEAFQLLDFDLHVSIGRDLNIKKIVEKDKNLGPGEFIVVGDVGNVTPGEIRKINSTIANTDLGNRFIFLSDRENAFLITGRAGDVLDHTYGQNLIDKDSANDSIVPFAIVEEVPVFPGCENADNPRACFQENMQRHISKNFRYPEAAQKQGIQGRVSVMFTIGEEGNIVNIRKRGPSPLLENEVVRIIEKLPQMQPGKTKGKAVRVPFSIPINFKLQDEGFNPNSQDADYVKLQNEQNSEMTSDVRREYRDGIPFAQVENVPVFPGCEDASNPRTCFLEKIQRHISKNFNYPQEAQDIGIQGRVSILFLIDDHGNSTNIKTKGPDKTLEDEAARIISRLPQMKPGNHKGKNVNVPFSIPISFKLK